jgi:hypothetical protein
LRKRTATVTGNFVTAAGQLSVTPTQYATLSTTAHKARERVLYSGRTGTACGHFLVQPLDGSPGPQVTDFTSENISSFNGRRSGRIAGTLEVVLLFAEEQAVCSGRSKRKSNTFLPLLEHAIAYLPEFRVRFHIGLQFL